MYERCKKEEYWEDDEQARLRLQRECLFSEFVYVEFLLVCSSGLVKNFH